MITDSRGALPFAVEYRQLDADMMGFVYASWCDAYHLGNRSVRRTPFDRYKTAQRHVIAQCLDRGSTVVAVDPDERDPRGRRVVYGWACASNDEGVGVLHFAYVLVTRRRVGLCRELVRMAGAACGRQPDQYSHPTVTGDYVARRLYDSRGNLGLVSNPFAVVRMVSKCA